MRYISWDSQRMYSLVTHFQTSAGNDGHQRLKIAACRDFLVRDEHHLGWWRVSRPRGRHGTRPRQIGRSLWPSPTGQLRESRSQRAPSATSPPASPPRARNPRRPASRDKALDTAGNASKSTRTQWGRRRRDGTARWGTHLVRQCTEWRRDTRQRGRRPLWCPCRSAPLPVRPLL